MHNIGHIFAIYTAVLNIATHAIPQKFPVEKLWEGAPSFSLLQNFLLLEELDTHRHTKTSDDEVLVLEIDPGSERFALEFHCVAIALNSGELFFADIDLQIQFGKTTMVTGPIACGKTTILRTILGELVPVAGLITSDCESMGYSAQRTWLPPIQVRQIIIGGHAYFAERYRSVLIACCLDVDILQWPEGDSTVIGDPKYILTNSVKQRLVSTSCAIPNYPFLQCMAGIGTSDIPRAITPGPG